MTLADKGAAGPVAIAERFTECTGSWMPAEHQREKGQLRVFAGSSAAAGRRFGPVRDGSLVKSPIPEDLPRRLQEYRTVLASAWSPRTIHPSFEFTHIDVSRGQCGVTSAWLLHKLKRQPEIRATYCYGDIVSRDNAFDTITFHCWVEIEGSAPSERWIIDLTCDQFDVFKDNAVLCESHDSLLHRSIEYRASSRLSYGELKDDLVWKRFKKLKNRVRVASPIAICRVLVAGGVWSS